MRIRVKKYGAFSDKKIESISKIDKIQPRNGEAVSIYFKTQNSSGIIDFTTEELDSFLKLIKLPKKNQKISAKNYKTPQKIKRKKTKKQKIANHRKF